MYRLHLLILFIFISFASSGQILNAESLRKVTDTSGFSGAASLNFALKRNTNDFITLSNNIHVQYKMNNHLVLFKNDIAFQKIEGDDFENSGIQHLRYNYKLKPRLAWEAFGQAQYNKINKIKFRGLLGTGPRFKVSKADNYRVYIGTLAMLEYEEVDDGATPLQKDFRGSTYLSFSLYPTNNVSIVSTTYYQPLLKEISDYRISSQSALVVSMFKNFGLKLAYTFIYDAQPAVGIPNSQYDFTTGINYSFD
ncbi:hypothetical protein ULMS_08560 [Patiriisocius marinistellae]|uniref:DUF481 domain-containing protein n=1 Tax=Patiriisocius marinistellae TaxID=2494560 RepID=A0A5J4FVW4_9FLAO|nr:DUF481 domain-containing protein [Patiriisocius marinistellae]GEQ85348.1 hypothetical protein ULMS_08560 [Patiriisocius marinistellae]